MEPRCGAVGVVQRRPGRSRSEWRKGVGVGSYPTRVVDARRAPEAGGAPEQAQRAGDGATLRPARQPRLHISRISARVGLQVFVTRVLSTSA